MFELAFEEGKCDLEKWREVGHTRQWAQCSKRQAEGSACTGVGELARRLQPWWDGSGGKGE